MSFGRNHGMTPSAPTPGPGRFPMEWHENRRDTTNLGQVTEKAPFPEAGNRLESGWKPACHFPVSGTPGVPERAARVSRLAAITARPAFQAAMAEDGPAQIYTRDFYEAPDG